VRTLALTATEEREAMARWLHWVQEAELRSLPMSFAARASRSWVKDWTEEHAG